MKTKKIKEALLTKHPKRREVVPDKDLLKSGSTVLDLAITGRKTGGFPKGRYIWMVGDSSSGKTFLMLTCLAEAACNPEFADYRFIYDNGEDGALMDLERYFGRSMADRLEPPAGDRQNPVYSETIEDLYYHLDDAFDAAEEEGGRPFIYLQDSMDVLNSDYARTKFQEHKRAARGGPKAKGDFGDGKAKMNSIRIREVINRLRKTGSMLILLSQTRDNINAGPFDEKQTHAGGRALRFYAAVQLWSSVGKKIRKRYRGNEETIGVTCRVRVKKNRITGRERTVEFPIYYDHGIDDIGGMIEWLCKWGFWKRNKNGVIDATSSFSDVKMRAGALITWVIENEMREDLEEVVEDAHQKVEAGLSTGQKSKYAP